MLDVIIRFKIMTWQLLTPRSPKLGTREHRGTPRRAAYGLTPPTASVKLTKSENKKH